MSEFATEGEAERFEYESVGPLPADHWACYRGTLTRAKVTPEGIVYQFKAAPVKVQKRAARRNVDNAEPTVLE